MVVITYLYNNDRSSETVDVRHNHPNEIEVVKSKVDDARIIRLDFQGTTSRLWTEHYPDRISSCLYLSHLYIPSHHISSISFVSSLYNLEVLHAENNNITDVSMLSSLVNLRRVNIGSNSVKDISFVKDLPHLVSLRAGYNHIVDLSPLKNITSLRKLYLTQNGITDISDLGQLPKLEKLYISDNRITDISPISKISTLKVFQANRNLITTILPLIHNSSLVTLFLIGNNVKDRSIVLTMSNIESFSSDSNKYSYDDEMKHMYTNIRNSSLKNTTYHQILVKTIISYKPKS